jgi:hypothetical protein
MSCSMLLEECDFLFYSSFIYLEECKRCGCHWKQHKHINYEYQINLTHLNANQQPSLSAIDQRISDLREEQRKIEDVYKKTFEIPTC